ncbi:FtsW/RodA/SpoVE family cell cycle protein [Clostridium sardiniense]|uniref:FtsW/RodA/SpoVE family cell cycle protein n=1 Tax=Clostridium sardiniense TaxID=29369 RepID=A0ABS7KYS1_CLOSR|nr:FtsW/RodA/SpoVE family cell cycle protein [Clostridium sardiniense]MBY0755954.1 FtsW/RodA/SpoVE family cell cycle protein [Clostridium sardiniense]MDQ0460756.1 cell division protein FtsW (lipid II flippase) [Clostridium sardiniense]
MNIENNKLVNDYLDNVCSNIRNTRMHSEIREELLCHIEDRFLSDLDKGLDDEEAIKNAVTVMGDYKKVGNDLNKIHKPSIEWGILISTILILCIGLIALNSLSNSLDLRELFISRSLVFSLIGIVLLFLSSYFNYIKLNVWSKKIYITSILLLLLCLFHEEVIGGSRAFLVLGSVSINILELSPILILISLCNLVKGVKECKSKMDFLEVYTLCFMPLIFMITFRNIPCIAIYVVGVCTILKIKKYKNRYILIPILVCFLLFLFALDGYRFMRLTSFLNPSSDPQGGTYIYNQIHTALSNSVFIGQANDFTTYLMPGFEGDFIFTFIIYRFGFLAGFITVLLCGFLLFKISKILMKVKNTYNKSLIIIMLTTLCIKFIYGILMNLGMAPHIPISIPFLSYGGTSGIINLMLIGLILNIYKIRNLSNIESLNTCNK